MTIPEGDFCSFHCVCDGEASVSDKISFATTCTQVFDPKYNVNATFQWLYIVTGNSQLNGTFAVAGGPTQVFSGFTGLNHTVTATSDTLLPANGLKSSFTLYNINQLLAEVYGGAMSCVPFRGAAVYDSKSIETYWQASPGMKTDLITVDFVMRNISLDGKPSSWVVALPNLQHEVSFRYYFNRIQCEPLEVAFLGTFNLRGFPNIKCPSPSSSLMVYLRSPPSTPKLLNFSLARQGSTTNFTVTVDWLPAQDNGGCANVTYMHGIFSTMNSTIQWGIFPSESVVGTAPQRWVVHNVPMPAGAQYMLTVRSSTVAGEGPSVYSDPFGPPSDGRDRDNEWLSRVV